MDKTTRNVLIVVALVALLIVASRGFTNRAQEEESEPTRRPIEANNGPTDTELAIVEDEMGEWAEGRWPSFNAHWEEADKEVVLAVNADDAASSTAIDSYCGILLDIATAHLSNFDVTARVIQNGRFINCS